MHRKTGQEIFTFLAILILLANISNVFFRIGNKIAELWNAATGETKKQAHIKSEGETTRFRISLDAAESAFIVFREF